MGYIKEKDGVIYQVERRKLTPKEESLLKKHIALEKSSKLKPLKEKSHSIVKFKAVSKQ